MTITVGGRYQKRDIPSQFVIVTTYEKARTSYPGGNVGYYYESNPKIVDCTYENLFKALYRET